MLMYSNNQPYYPQPQSLPYNTNPFRNNHRQDFSENKQQINARLKTFHVEIRNKQLKAYKNRIREEFLRTSKIDELLDNMPNDNESSRFWALQLARQYSCSQKYTINLHQALDIFKIAQRFPNRQTLELLQVVIIRVQGDIVDEMFQYDVMRLLHGFINFSGKPESFIITQSPIEEVQMLKDNVVITEATEQIERAQNLSVTYLDRLEMARLTITIISQLCRKQQHTRNFAILNHKTFNYCSKLYKIFGDKIKIEYYMLLEAATKYPFERYGDRQFKRMIDTIINTFFDQKMDIKIEILSQNNKRSYLKAYEYIIGAIKNLLSMQNPEIMIRILKPNPMGQIWIIPLMKSVIEQCNYVLSYPSVQQNLEQFMPLNIMSTIVDLLIIVKDQFDKYPMNQLSCSLAPILRELLCVIQNKNISMHLKSGILTRRGTYFLLSNHLYEIGNYSIEQLLSLIYFNPKQKENLIDMLSFYLRNEVQYLSVAQLCNLIKSIFVNVPVSLYEALLIPSQLFQTMVEKILQTYYSVGSKMLSNEDSCNNMILYTADQFFESVGPEIGERVNLYIKILQANSERLYMKYQSEQIRSDIREVLYKLLSMCNQRGHIQQV